MKRGNSKEKRKSCQKTVGNCGLNCAGSKIQRVLIPLGKLL